MFDWNGLVQDCGISSANALEIPQSYTKSLTSYKWGEWLILKDILWFC